MTLVAACLTFQMIFPDKHLRMLLVCCLFHSTKPTPHTYVWGFNNITHAFGLLSFSQHETNPPHTCGRGDNITHAFGLSSSAQFLCPGRLPCAKHPCIASSIGFQTVPVPKLSSGRHECSKQLLLGLTASRRRALRPASPAEGGAAVPHAAPGLHTSAALRLRIV